MKAKKPTVTDKLITRITGWIAIALLLALLVWGIETLWEYHRYEQTNDAQVQEYVNPVISRAGGFIVAVKFEENQPVKKGDTLLIIDNREYNLQVDQTRAMLEKEVAQLAVLNSNTNTLRQTSRAAQSQIAAAQAKVWKQQLDYDRYQKLYNAESATAQQLENVKANLDIYQSDFKAAQDNYAASVSRIQDTESEKAVVSAEMERLKALLDRHKLDLSYTVITAPYDGRMGRRTIEKGQMINAGEVLAYIVDNETDKWVVANYKETQVAHMQVGDSVKIKADAYPDKTFRGTIISLSPATGSSFSLLPPDNATGNYVKIVQRVPVRIRINGSRSETDVLRAGMNVSVFINKQQHARG
ncbi:membrane fusion protein, multidrug efflux system [Chitinophaga costaii]|uniref:Membrane fusion protein, multidrug efflux system n=1 Tax=Chitinophaga costaii TaxID=1335309 RepID=A0A1C4EV04_9BACT|nr:HlyD family secretion protein [Chitinophaga costaii]PUZ21635.1 HlyD family secretion protein [Chitinophaga costaii]SCC47340.1 membrane fusion protein, multidrug efflux system [Chitinophaga costaii]